jgi:hypothetical protein
MSDHNILDEDEACWLAHRLAGRAELLEELVDFLTRRVSQPDTLTSLKIWIQSEIADVNLETEVFHARISGRA